MLTVVEQIFKQPVFETQRLVAGQWHRDLAEQALAIYGDPEVTRWLDGVVQNSVESMEAYIERLIQRNRNWPMHWGSWPIFHKESRQLIGTMMLKPIPGDDQGNLTDDIEIGWHLARDHWGNGYATEGGRRLIKIGFEDLGLKELIAVTDPANSKSQSVASRLGMKNVGKTECYYGQSLDLFKIRNGE